MNEQKERPYRVWCAPCEQVIEFAPDGWDAVQHANRHGAVIVWTERNGRYIGEPMPEHTPAPAITTEEVLDYFEMPLDVVSAMAREVLRHADAV